MDRAQPVAIGVVGAGRMGAQHLRALRQARGVTVAGVVEPVAKVRRAAAEQGYPTFARAEELLAQRPVDAILIAAPSDLHLLLVRTLAAQGLPILCEKPVGVRAAQAMAAATAVAEHGTLLQVGYWRRFVPALRALRERIAGGELGEILAITCLQWDESPPGSAFRARSGGIAVDMAVHEFDQIRWLTGQDVTWLVAAPGGTLVPGPDPDAATILARLSGGAAATISVGRHFVAGDSCWIEVFGSRGYERVPFMWGKPGDAVFLDALVAQVEAFADSVRGAPLSGAGGQDAVAALHAGELSSIALERAPALGIWHQVA